MQLTKSSESRELGSKNVMQKILVAEDEPEVRNYLEMALRCQGYLVESTENGEEALAYLQENRDSVSAVLLDLMMPRKNGMETLREIRSIDPDLPVIMISAAASPFNVVDAMRCGAVDFLGKPVSHEELRKTMKCALERRPKKREAAPSKAFAKTPRGVFFSANPEMKALESLVEQIGWSEAPVLIQGETGVGKEVFARQLHGHSPRNHKPLLKLNCAALPSELVESELFGYERGAFTGAFQKKLGMFELADGGTLFLDEIGDMPFKLQAKLLQVLQDQEFQRLGGKETIRVDVRIMAATHNDLAKAVSTRTFREDLYYRLNVISMRVPPLRERREDILPLAEFLLMAHAPAGRSVPMLTPALQQALLNHAWPGNVRELENIMRRLLVLRSPDLIAAGLARQIPDSAGALPAPPPAVKRPAANGDTITVRQPIFEQVTLAKNQAETEAILTALNSTRWNRKQASALLKIDYKALLYKMKKLSIEDKVPLLPVSESVPELKVF